MKLSKDFESIDIQSNPNFVFENDPNFEAVKLFDHDENSVFVNSFVECEHYVNGGWDFFPELKNENILSQLIVRFINFNFFSRFLHYEKNCKVRCLSQIKFYLLK